MPTTYECSFCGCFFLVGSYHGFKNDWYNALYCRHCGARYFLKQSHKQFSDDFARREPRDRTRCYELRGPMTIKKFEAKAGEPVTLRCEICDAEGPFGSGGPITDERPKGIPEPLMPIDIDREAKGECPRCKQKTMQATGYWIT